MSAQPIKQWEKASTGSGVVYYVNHLDKKNQWEHPNYQVMLEMLDDCNSIKYAAYRTAAKLCVLQRFFSMNLVPVNIIAGVFDKHQMRTTENNLDLSSSELEDIIYDILFATHTSTSQHSLINVDLNTELILNFLLSVFDSSKRKSVKVLCSKIVLTILSASSMQSKIHYLFEQLSDHNHCISKRKMEFFLQSCSSLMFYLAESHAFSPDLIKPTLKTCFQGNDKFVGLSEDAFVRWFLSEPRIVLWFPIFYRLKTAENEIHQVACSTCKIQPIRGLRYKCMRCISYDQCQNCFFTRKISRRHKLRHPMQEYCWQGASRRSTLEYLKTLIKRICGYDSRLQYLPVEPSDIAALDTDVTAVTETQGSNHTLTSLKPEFELSSIIGLLELENKRLEKEMKNIDSNYLKEHKDQIRTQIQRLRKVKTHINLLCSAPGKLPRMQSTPVIKYPTARAPSFDNLFSPIAASDTSTSGVSMSPHGSLSPGSRETAGSKERHSVDTGTFSMGTFDSRATGSTIDSRVLPEDLSTWIGKRNLSRSRDKFDFSALLCPKQIGASYRVITDEGDKENQENEDRGANSSFSLDEVLAQYECDSRFSSSNVTVKSSKSLKKKTKSLFDIRGKRDKKETVRSALSTVDLENSIPCDRLRQENASRLSHASCYSRTSLLSRGTSVTSCENLMEERSMNSEDYLNTIRKTCTDMYSMQETAASGGRNRGTGEQESLSGRYSNQSGSFQDTVLSSGNRHIREQDRPLSAGRYNNQSESMQDTAVSSGRRSNQSEREERNISRRDTGCQDRIRRRQNPDTSGNISTQTLPRMFRTPLQNSSAHMNEINGVSKRHSAYEAVKMVNMQQSLQSGVNKGSFIEHSKYESCVGTPSQNLSRSSESLLVNTKLSAHVSKHSLSSTVKSTSYRDLSRAERSHLSRSERKGLCDSLNSLLSQEGVIEQSIGNLSSEVVMHDEQLVVLQGEIDNILHKLRTILATV